MAPTENVLAVLAYYRAVTELLKRRMGTSVAYPLVHRGADTLDEADGFQFADFPVVFSARIGGEHVLRMARNAPQVCLSRACTVSARARPMSALLPRARTRPPFLTRPGLCWRRCFTGRGWRWASPRLRSWAAWFAHRWRPTGRCTRR